MQKSFLRSVNGVLGDITGDVVVSGGGTTSASNGLTKVGDDFQLGGTLDVNTYIDGGSNKLSVTSTGQAFYAEGGIGVAVQAYSENNLAYQGYSTNDRCAVFTVSPTYSNTIISNLLLSRGVDSFVAQNGIGQSLDFSAESSSGNGYYTNRIISKFTNATDGLHTSEFSITGLNIGIEYTLLTLAGTGSVTFNRYGSGLFSGTASYGIAVDASGNLMEVPLGVSSIKQIHTSGITATVSNTTTWLIVDPISILASLSVILPISPTDSQDLMISFGGTITSGGVVTSISFSPSPIDSNTPDFVSAGEHIGYRWNETNSKWYRIN